MIRRRGCPRGGAGWVIFATTVLFLVGFSQIMMGVTGLFHDGYFRATRFDLLVPADHIVWGCVHIGLGVVTCVAGLGVMLYRRGAGPVAVGMAGASAYTNLAYAAANPVLSAAIIVLDVIAVYALIVYGDEIRAAAFDG